MRRRVDVGSPFPCCPRNRRRRALERRFRDRGRGDPGRRPGIRHNRAGERTRADAGLVLRNRGTEEEISAPRPPTRAVNSSSATRQVSPRGHLVDGELRRTCDRRSRDAGHRATRRRRIRHQRPKVLAMQRRGLGQQGRQPELVVVRTDPDAGGTAGLSAIMIERGTPGITYNSISTSAQRSAPNCEISSTTPECLRAI